MLFIVLIALATTVVIQTVRLREAESREQRLRAESEAMRAFVQQSLVTARDAAYRAQIFETDAMEDNP